jgi:hypothetical protein
VQLCPSMPSQRFGKGLLRAEREFSNALRSMVASFLFL